MRLPWLSDVKEIKQTQITEDVTEKDAKRDTVLIVEDNHDMRSYLISLLDKEYHLFVAEDGKQGLEKVLAHKPDLVLSDVMMPVMDGFELCTEIKKNESTSHIPVILITAKVDLSRKLEGFQYGADDYLSKPFSPRELMSRIHVFLNRESMRKQLVTLTDELKAVNTELKEKNEFKSKYLANMSHEIRTPMNAIMGYNQQIMLGGYDSYNDILDIYKDIMDTLKASEKDVNKDQYQELQSVCSEYKRLVFDTEKELKEHFFMRLNEILHQDSGSDQTVIESLQKYVDEIGTYLTDEKENTHKALQTSNRSGQYLLDLINSILDIAKIEAGKVTVEPKEVDLNEFIIDIYNNADAYRKAKDKTDKVNLIKKVSDSITGKATFDPRRIKQVLLNLLSNAIKFTHKGDVVLSIDRDDDNLVFSVKDSGVGIKANEMDKLFKEFGRTSSTKDIEGTGLGLALSKKLVDLHGGKIEVESEYGNGSEFRVVLPVKNNI